MSTSTSPDTADAAGAGKFGTRYPELFAMLAAPFEPNEVFCRVIEGEGPKREELYIRPRAAMNRLDNVIGPENWEDDCTSFGANGSVKCVLTLTMPDGRKVRKSGIGSPQKKERPNADKSAESDAFKRAAMKFGIARYLYRDGVPTFAAEVTSLEGPACPLTPAAAARFERGPTPEPARPQREPERRAAPQARREPERQAPAQPGQGRPPRTGKALFAWTKDQEQRYEVGMLKYLNQWSKLQDFPGRMIDWDADQVALAYAEACRKLAHFETEGGRADDMEEAMTSY